MKNNKKKGFTLVELIVVLVILAILLAILIPALTGWITKAREKQVIIDARTAYLAAQTVESEEFGGHKFASSYVRKDGDTIINGGSPNDILDLAQLNTSAVSIVYKTNENAQVTDFKYSDGNYIATYSTSTGLWDVTSGTVVTVFS